MASFPRISLGTGSTSSVESILFSECTEPSPLAMSGIYKQNYFYMSCVSKGFLTLCICFLLHQNEGTKQKYGDLLIPSSPKTNRYLYIFIENMLIKLISYLVSHCQSSMLIIHIK